MTCYLRLLQKIHVNFLNILKMQLVLISVLMLSASGFILEWLFSTEKHLVYYQFKLQ